jgi:tRNA dimethylallyltransferase
MVQKTLLAVTGPTGIGKTSLAIKLAKHYNTEILSADSRQFYKEMRIGTAVPSSEELHAAPHHFIQHKSIEEPYSVGDFERESLQLLNELFKAHNVVVVVGGSGLYIDAVLYGFDYFPSIDVQVRTQLIKELETGGLEPLQKELRASDPDYAKKADLNNPQRVIRALEVSRGSGKPYSSFLGHSKPIRPFRTVLLGLDAPREIVYQRINERVDQMMKEGLLEEVKSLQPFEQLNALQTVGYKELFRFLNKEYSLEEAVAEIKMNTRRFAKRQGTWFRKNKEIIWINYNMPFKAVLELVSERIKDE